MNNTYSIALLCRALASEKEALRKIKSADMRLMIKANIKDITSSIYLLKQNRHGDIRIPESEL